MTQLLTLAHFAVWPLTCATIAFFTRRRPDVLVGLILAVWLLVPSVSSELVTQQPSGNLSFLPGTWLVLISLPFQLIFRLQPMIDSFRKYLWVFIAVLAVVAAAIAATKLQTSGVGLVVMEDEILGPFGVFWLIVSAVPQFPKAIPALRSLVIWLTAAESLLAVAQSIAHRPIFFTSGYEGTYWYQFTVNRWFGTIDHPLGLSFLLCVATALLVGVRRIYVQIPVLALFVVAALLTQSRTGLAFVVIAGLWLILRSTLSASAKWGTFIVLGVAGGWLATTSLAAGISSRIADDGGSAGARQDAYAYFLSHLGSYTFHGGGVGSSYALGRQFGLITSLESSILMYTVDLGVIFSLLYFGTQLVLVVRRGGHSRIPGLTLAGIAVLVIPQSYSGLASSSPAGVLVWLVLGLCAASTEVPLESLGLRAAQRRPQTLAAPNMIFAPGFPAPSAAENIDESAGRPTASAGSR